MNAVSGATILVIEDNAAVRQGIATYLEGRDFRALEAENGRVGLEVFRTRRPDLVLVDLRMPEVDGLEVLATLTGESPDTPVIVVSGTGAIADAVEALHLGAWDYLLKPIADPVVLFHAVEKSLERARLIRRDREYQQHLEKEVRLRTAELEEANAALRREMAERELVEAELRNNERRFRLLYEETPLGYQSLDAEGRFIEVNRAWLEMLGYRRDEVIGRSFGDFVAQHQVELFRQRFPRFKARGETLGAKFEMVRKDGSHVLVSIDGRVGRDEQGNFRQTHCVLHDVTEQIAAEEALRESEERFRSLS
ncbi:MAG TPA: response regulator, partial [Thermoguttaceae bacterium]|nr:response regulator [Thermoguttaceae bacterium]